MSHDALAGLLRSFHLPTMAGIYAQTLKTAEADHWGYARADILNPVGTDEWEIVEVKSSTDVKEVFLEDIAFQHFVFTGAGLRIRSCFILHVNNTYIRSGEIDPAALLRSAAVQRCSVASG